MKMALCSYSMGVANGIARMDGLLLRALRDLGVDATLCVLCPKGGPATPPAGSDNTIVLDLEEAMQVLPRLFGKMDAVQFNGSFDPIVTAAAVEAGVPALVEVMHNTEPGGMYAEIDRIVCVSEAVRAMQLDARACVILNAIALERFPLRVGRHSVDGPVLLQIANSYKTLHVELEEMVPLLRATFPALRAIRAGGRGEASTAFIENVGVVDDPCPLYHAADVLFLPSVHDAFGLVLAEAQASGCLVIGNRHTGAFDIIEHGVTGWLTDNDRASMRKSCETALHMAVTVQHEGMQRRASEAAHRRFAPERCARDYLRLYESLPAQRRPGRRFSARAWQPLLMAVQYSAHDMERAVDWLCHFARQGQRLEPALQAHPNGQSTLAVCFRLLDLLLECGERAVPKAVCELLYASRLAMPELERLYRRAGGKLPGCDP